MCYPLLSYSLHYSLLLSESFLYISHFVPVSFLCRLNTCHACIVQHVVLHFTGFYLLIYSQHIFLRPRRFTSRDLSSFRGMNHLTSTDTSLAHRICNPTMNSSVISAYCLHHQVCDGGSECL